MSQENVEVVRRLYAGWQRGDFAVEMDSYDPAVELVIDFGFERVSARGIDQMRQAWREQLTLWESWTTGPIDELIEEGDHVVVVHSLRGLSRRGLSIDLQDAGAAITFRRGKVIRIVATSERRKALEAVGLSEQAMSQENADIAKRAYRAFTRGDWDVFVALLEPDVEFESLILEAEGGSYRGHAGAREYFDNVRAVFREWEVEIVAMRHFADAVLTEARVVGTGGSSAVTVEQRFWHASTISSGKIVWWKFCRSEAEALEAVALREQRRGAS